MTVILSAAGMEQGVAAKLMTLGSSISPGSHHLWSQIGAHQIKGAPEPGRIQIRDGMIEVTYNAIIVGHANSRFFAIGPFKSLLLSRTV